MLTIFKKFENGESVNRHEGKYEVEEGRSASLIKGALSQQGME